MILEWIEYFRTPASREARRFGLVRESIALRARAQRQRRSWQSHLQNCYRAADNFATEHSRAQSILILGSGHLFDISPRIFENENFEKIYLVDLVHPLEVRKRFREDPRVELVEMDLSGGLSQSRFDPGSLQKPKLPKTDLLISANLMSQLPLPWTTRAEDISESQRIEIETSLCQNHWRLLKSHAEQGSEILFWTDFEKMFFDTRNELIHRENSLGNFTFPVRIEKWEWDIAPIPEISGRLGLQMQVACGQIRKPKN